MGYQHSSVNHQSGEYARQSSQYDGVVVHTNSIEGVWGSYKNWLRGMKGDGKERHRPYLYEFMWRHNIAVTAPKSPILMEVLKLMSKTKN